MIKRMFVVVFLALVPSIASTMVAPETERLDNKILPKQAAIDVIPQFCLATVKELHSMSPNGSDPFVDQTLWGPWNTCQICALTNYLSKKFSQNPFVITACKHDGPHIMFATDNYTNSYNVFSKTLAQAYKDVIEELKGGWKAAPELQDEESRKEWTLFIKKDKDWKPLDFQTTTKKATLINTLAEVFNVDKFVFCEVQNVCKSEIFLWIKNTDFSDVQKIFKFTKAND